MNWSEHPESWFFILRQYLPRLAFCSLVWEVAQLPLYTLWAEASPGSIAFAVAHCTAGDVLIGTGGLLVALILGRASQPADWPGTRIAGLTIVVAIAYTLISERINLARGNWAYAEWMPLLPWLEVGLAPMSQWVVVPLAAWWWAKRQAPGSPGLK